MSHVSVVTMHWSWPQEKMLVEMENCRVLVSDQKVEQMKDIIPVLEQITRQNQPLLIVTEDITGTHHTLLQQVLSPECYVCMVLCTKRQDDLLCFVAQLFCCCA